MTIVEVYSRAIGKFYTFTQPAVVMVVTNMRCDDDDDLSGGGDEADCVEARSSS